MGKRYIGTRLQRLREERGLNQVALARLLEISPSYLNQIERNQRPLTMAVMLRMHDCLGVEMGELAEDGEAGLIGELRDVLAQLGRGHTSIAEIKSMAGNMPGVARALIDLHHDYILAKERADTLIARFGDIELGATTDTPAAGDQVRNYFNRRHNHVAELDDAAEALFIDNRMAIGQIGHALTRRLAERHGIAARIVPSHEIDPMDKRDYDPRSRSLLLPDHMRPGQQAFQMAAQLAVLEYGAMFDVLTADAGFDDSERQRLMRIGLANYFAGALVMPYTPFLDAAEHWGYDIERLAHRFGVGFEAVCHRLSTLQRPGMPGLPFFFVRVDRAGNVSKRHSATDFHFTRVGGSCPLWIVYEAFNQPGQILTQVADMPDGRRHFWMARQVTSGPVGYGQPRKTFAVSLGCDLEHAGRLVYSRGLDLANTPNATPIGPGCRVCERQDCLQRAFPALSLRYLPGSGERMSGAP